MKKNTKLTNLPNNHAKSDEDEMIIDVAGSIDTPNQLPKNAKAGTAYFVGTTTPQHVYCFDGTKWEDKGAIHILRKFYIYGTISGRDSADELEKAIEIANKKASYTQQDIVITDETNKELIRRRWWNMPFNPANDDSQDPIEFGDLGYYSDWEIIQ